MLSNNRVKAHDRHLIPETLWAYCVAFLKEEYREHCRDVYDRPCLCEVLTYLSQFDRKLNITGKYSGCYQSRYYYIHGRPYAYLRTVILYIATTLSRILLRFPAEQWVDPATEIPTNALLIDNSIPNPELPQTEIM